MKHFYRATITVALLAASPLAAQAACEDYDSQGAAQHAFTLGAYELDTTGSGVACEDFFSTPTRRSSRASSMTCADFSDQPSAQRAYQTGARHLDENRNGRACDSHFSSATTTPSMSAACANFTTREQAQDAFISGQDGLDRDMDGLACEHLPSLNDLEASDQVDSLGSPSFLWHKNDLGVQPRTSRPLTHWSDR